MVSNIGSWMSDIGVNWTMLSLSADPLAVALVQAASSLPMFLFVLPAGVLADIVERRKILLFSQVWTFCAAAGLALLSFTGNVTPEVLLAATFLLSTGAALSSPCFSGHRAGSGGEKQELSRAIASIRWGSHQSCHRPRVRRFDPLVCRAVDGVYAQRPVRTGCRICAAPLETANDTATSAA